MGLFEQQIKSNIAAAQGLVPAAFQPTRIKHPEQAAPAGGLKIPDTGRQKEYTGMELAVAPREGRPVQFEETVSSYSDAALQPASPKRRENSASLTVQDAVRELKRTMRRNDRLLITE